MPTAGATKPEGATNFDGEEPTEVLAFPRGAQKTIEMRLPEPEPVLQDEEGPERTYLAPRSIPTQAVPDQGPEDDKIVINVKTPAPAEVAEVAPDQPKIDAERARRRAPTVRIERGTLKAQGLLGAMPATDDIDVSFDAEVAAAEPPPELGARRAVKRADAGGDWGGRDAATQVMPKPAPKGSSFKMVLLGVVLIVALGGGTVFALGWLGVIDVPGVSESEAAAAPTAKPAPTVATAVPTPQPVAQPTQEPTAEPVQTQTAETAVPTATSAPVKPTATTPKPVVKPRWVPPASTRANPTTI